MSLDLCVYNKEEFEANPDLEDSTLITEYNIGEKGVLICKAVWEKIVGETEGFIGYRRWEMKHEGIVFWVNER